MKVKPDNKCETLRNIREWLVELVKGSAIAMVIDVKRKIPRMRQQSLRLLRDEISVSTSFFPLQVLDIHPNKG